MNNLLLVFLTILTTTVIGALFLIKGDNPMKKTVIIFLAVLTVTIIATRYNNKELVHKHEHSHSSHNCSCCHH